MVFTFIWIAFAYSRTVTRLGHRDQPSRWGREGTAGQGVSIVSHLVISVS